MNRNKPKPTKSDCYALIEFEDEDDAEHAIFNMNNSEFFGYIIRVDYSKIRSRIGKFAKAVWKEEFEQKPPEDEKAQPDDDKVMSFDQE